MSYLYFLLLAPIKFDSILWDVYVFIRNQFSEFSEVCSLLTSRGLYHCKQRAQSAGNRDREREQAEAARTKRQFLTPYCHYRDNPVIRLTRGLIRLIRHGSSTPGWWGGGLLVTKDRQHRLVWGKLRGEDWVWQHRPWMCVHDIWREVFFFGTWQTSNNQQKGLYTLDSTRSHGQFTFTSFFRVFKN